MSGRNTNGHLRLLYDALREKDEDTIFWATSKLPCTIYFNDNPYIIYVKYMSEAHFKTNDNVWRAQLPRLREFDACIKSEAAFIFLGYDKERDVYVTWHPENVKQRLNKVANVSFYSRLSAQEDAQAKHGFVRVPLGNGGEALAFPRSLLKEYLLRKDAFFPSTTSQHAPVKEGKILKVVEQDLLDKLEPYLNQEQPQLIPAMTLAAQYYANVPNLKMEFKDWTALVSSIDWTDKK